MRGSSRAFRGPTLLFTGTLVPRRLLIIALACLTGAVPAAAHAHADKRGGELRSASNSREARATLREAKALLDGHGVESGRELTPVLKDLAVRMKALPAAEEREARAILLRPTQGQAQAGEDAYVVPEAVGSPFCSSHFCIHWVSADPREPERRDTPPLDSNDGDSIPDYIQTMSRTFEEVFAAENIQMAWREPTRRRTRGRRRTRSPPTS
jgi:hypothetical protein